MIIFNCWRGISRFAVVSFALLSTCIAQEAQIGQWGPVIDWKEPDPSQGFVGIHANLLPNGKVLFWNRRDYPTLGGTYQQVRLWDPGDADPRHLTMLQNPETDIFCGSQVLLPDGTLFIAGGHITDLNGTRDTTLFDYRTNAFTTRRNTMNNSRWYPSTCLTGSGEVAILLGSFSEGGVASVPEVWSSNGQSRRDLTSADINAIQGGINNGDFWYYYPWMHLAPNGQIFISGPYANTYYFNTNGTGSWTPVGPTVSGWRGAYLATSVCYDEGRILITGGIQQDSESIDLNTDSPSWHQVQSPSHPTRLRVDSTILADGSIFVSGGKRVVARSAPNDYSNDVLTPEIWNPNLGNRVSDSFLLSGQWTSVAPMTVPRYYHSIALLLPDARVLVAGGGAGGDQPNDTQFNYSARPNAQIYSPPYLFRSARPTIQSAPDQVSLGQRFTVQTDQADQIQSVNLIRLSTVTHSFNTGQIINHLSFSRESGFIEIAAPRNPNVCPPGYYMLFVLNAAGTPSKAAIIRVINSGPQSTKFIEPMVGDFDGSHKAAIMLCGINGWNTVYQRVAHSRGDGGFDVTNTPGNFGPSARAGAQKVIGDFNGDGKQEIAWVSPEGSHTIVTAFSNGDGTFAVHTFASWLFSNSCTFPGAKLVSGDFNGDGKTDLALVGGVGWTSIAIAFSNGDGSFSETNIDCSFFATCATQGSTLIVGDFNGDGKTDLALTGGPGWNTLPVAFSNGNGSFSVTNDNCAFFAACATQGATVMKGDFNGDGKMDLALVGGPGWNTVPVALSNGNGSFNVTNNSLPDFAVWATQGAKLVTGDFNADGKTDIALVGGPGWNTVPVAFSNGNGSFTSTNRPAPNFASIAPTAAAILVGDFNGDGKSDIALTGGDDWQTVPVAFSTGTGDFSITSGMAGAFARWASQ